MGVCVLFQILCVCGLEEKRVRWDVFKRMDTPDAKFMILVFKNVRKIDGDSGE